MPTGPAPERFRDLLESTALGHLATLTPGGKPQVNPVWFIYDGAQVLLSVRPETNKYRNLRANPAVAISISDPERPDRYLELRGTVTEFELFDTLSWVNQLARKYTGADYTRGQDGEQRYKVTIRVESWTAQG
jgi:PPOX class probable F420-dependent enzyme